MALTLLLPTYKKFSHLFANHKHDICLGEKASHFHELNADCDLYKFHLNNAYCVFYNDVELLCQEYFNIASGNEYIFLKNHKQLPFSLRGPPILV